MFYLLKLSRSHFSILTYETYETIMIKPAKMIILDNDKDNFALLLEEKDYEYQNFATEKTTAFYKVLMNGKVFWAHWIYFDKI